MFKGKRKIFARTIIQVVMIVFFAFVLNKTVFASAVSWDGGAGTSNWEDANNWSNNQVPTSSDDVTIDSNVTVNINNSTTIHSLTLGNGGGSTSPTLNFSYNSVANNALTITGGDLTVNTNANITHSAGTASVVGIVSINVTSGNATVNGTVNANSKGYAGVTTGASGTAGNGTGGGGTATANGAGGGGYGGAGGSSSLGGAVGGTVYDNYYNPQSLGSSSGEDGYTGGGQRTSAAGGGAIIASVSGTLTVTGSITANGATANNDGSGGGSGGTVNLTVGTIAGSGSITSNGGSAPSNTYSSSGGGGRIAIKYSTNNSFFGSGGGNGTLTATAGTTGYTLGENGTIAVVDTANNDLYINRTQTWRVKNSAGTTTDGASFTYRNVYVGNQSQVTWTLLGYSSNNSDGVGQTFNVINFTISGGSIISGNGGGYPKVTSGNAGKGPGAGGTASVNGGGGGGYGGTGGSSRGLASGGSVNGSLSAPVDLGSSGGTDNFAAGRYSAEGGGALYINARTKITLSGSISMNGNNSAYDAGGGGSGGSVYLRAGNLEGSGSVTANGGNAFTTTYSGGGGGGRVAIIRSFNNFKGTVTVTGGTGFVNGGTGTIFYGNLPNLSWGFDEGSGTTAKDSSVLNNPGTITGATYSSDHTGKGGKFALQLSGSGQYVSKSYSADAELDPYTDSFAVSVWFKHGSTAPASGTHTLIARYSSGGYKIYMNTSGQICFGIDDDSSWGPDDSVCSTTSYADSTWHHVEAVKTTTSSVNLYMDGNLVKTLTTLTATGSLSGSSPTFYAGIDSDGSSNAWNGFIDDVNYYPGSRTAAQVKADYQADPVGTVIGSSTTDPLTNGLVGYWKMDESSWTVDCSTTSVTDSSGNSNNGTACPNSTGPAGGAAGKFGNAGSFDGSNDYVSVANSSSINNPTSITVSAWAKLTSTTQGGIMTKLSSSGATGFDVEFSGNKMRVSVGGAGGTPTSNTSISTGVWNHLVMTFDGATTKFYLNGSPDGSSTALTTINNNSTAVSIGRTGDTSDGFSYTNGSLDEVRMYNRALSPAEVSQLYNFAPGPVGYWKFDEGQGSSVSDISGNSNNGTWSGAAGAHWVQGKYGKAGQFDGQTDMVNAGSGSILDDMPAISLGAWIYPRTAGEGNLGFIASKIVSLGPTNGWFFRETSTQQLNFRVNYSVTNDMSCNTSASVISLNRWQHVEFTWTGSSAVNGVHMYVNGTEVACTSNTDGGGSRVTDAAASLVIGNEPAGARTFDGFIDDFKIYNYVRNQEQVLEDMRGTSSIVPTLGGANHGGGYAAYWDFNEGYGTSSFDRSGNGNTGTLTSMSSPATAVSGWEQNGKFGKAIRFDGSNDYITAGNNASLQLASASAISAWVNLGSNNAVHDIVSKKGANGQWAFKLFTNSSGKLTFETSTDGNVMATASGNTTLSNNLWYHVVGTFDPGNKIMVYVNGLLDGQTNTTFASLKNSSANVNIGSENSGASNFMFGAIDEIKIYPYALTADEVKQEFQGGKTLVLGSFSDTSRLTGGSVASNSASAIYCVPGGTTSCAVPVLEYNFSEGSGTSANDTSGNNNTGNWTGAGSPHYAPGKYGNGANFDGATDMVQSSATTNFPTGSTASTLSVWFKVKQYTGNYQFLAAWGNGCCTTRQDRFVLLAPVSGTYYIQPGSFGDDHSTGESFPIALNTWYHVEWVYDGSTTSLLYVNGTLQRSHTLGGSLNTVMNSFNLRVASDNYNAFPEQAFGGVIDQLRIFNYARTAAQIAWDYNQGKPGSWFDFDECSGTTIHDRMVATNSGTLTIGSAGSQTAAGNCTDGTGTTAWNNGSIGKFNSSVKLDGTDDYINVSTPMNYVQSVSFWAYPTSTTQSFMQLNSSVSVSATSGVVSATGFTTPSIYVNGNLNGTITANTWNNITVTTGTSISANAIKLGLVGSTYFSGQIDDVKIFTFAPTAVQVRQIYNQGAGVRFGPNTGSP